MTNQCRLLALVTLWFIAILLPGCVAAVQPAKSKAAVEVSEWLEGVLGKAEKEAVTFSEAVTISKGMKGGKVSTKLTKTAWIEQLRSRKPGGLPSVNDLLKSPQLLRTGVHDVPRHLRLPLTSKQAFVHQNGKQLVIHRKETVTVIEKGIEKGGFLKASLPDNGQVLVEGEMNEELADLLGNAGVRIVRKVRKEDLLWAAYTRHEPDFARNLLAPSLPPRRIKIIVVGSTKPATQAIMFPNQPEQSVRRAMEMVQEIEGSVIVDNQRRLGEVLQDATKAGEQPIVVFHNEEGSILFAREGGTEDITINEFVEQFGKHDPVVLSCNTFDVVDLEVKTTGPLAQEAVMRTLKRTSQDHKGEVELEKYLSYWVKNYNSVIATAKKKRIMWMIGGGVTVTGAAVGFGEHVGTKRSKLPSEKNF
jgi:hypothetical protein